MEKVKVAIWGLGAMGSGMAKALLKKDGVEIVGVCVSRASRAGLNLYDVLEVEQGGRPDVILTNDIAEAIKPGTVDICLMATDSFIEKSFDKMEKVLNLGVNVITIAEEMAYPKAQQPELAKKLDEIAKKNGVSILGTGINPGLVMDLLAICLSGCMTDVESVFCERVNSLSPYGESVMTEQGIGITVDEFKNGVETGTLAGHVGFAESIGLISEAMGLGVDNFDQSMDPIVTDVDRKSPFGFAAAGNVAGVDMKGRGYKDGKLIVDMSHPQQIEPEQVGTETGDYIVLKGTPEVNMAIKPEISGGIGTIAMAINCIPQVINGDPGLLTMIDIPVPHVIMDDYRNHVKADKKLV